MNWVSYSTAARGSPLDITGVFLPLLANGIALFKVAGLTAEQAHRRSALQRDAG